MPRTETRKTRRLVTTLTEGQYSQVKALAEPLGMAAGEWTRALVLREVLDAQRTPRPKTEATA